MYNNLKLQDPPSSGHLLVMQGELSTLKHFDIKR